MKQTLTIIGILATLCLLGYGVHVLNKLDGQLNQPTPSFGGYASDVGFASATTSPNAASVKSLKVGAGVLGEVYVSILGTGTIVFYDATTTDITKRTGNIATSTITRITMAASTPVGVYPFNLSFSTGILQEFTGAVASTTTIYN